MTTLKSALRPWCCASAKLCARICKGSSEKFTKSLAYQTLSGLGVTDPIPGKKVSSTAQELYGRGIAVPDPVHAAGLSQQQLVAIQIQTTKKKARLGITTKRQRDELNFGLSLAKRLRTEGKFFRTVVASKTIEYDQYGSPEHVDVAFSQSGNRFGFKTLVSDRELIGSWQLKR